MPEPRDRARRYLPGLDGLRALAVSAVVAYHLGFGWAAGGFLGVSVFFTLSGYLITDLILSEFANGSFRLARFWRARARRLFPGLVLVLVSVTVWVTISGSSQPKYFSTLAAAALYASNWQLILRHVSYFARFGPRSPLEHLWSLGVEEQFYVLWPALLLIGARYLPERSRLPGIRPRLALLTLGLAVASTAEMALLYRPSLDTSRVYFGTDTRAAELLAGAALAMVWPSRLLRAAISHGARRLLDIAAIVGLTTIAIVVWKVNEYSPFVYRGGFALVTASTVLLVATLAHPAGRIANVLGADPLRWLGVRSYGIYLWHLPVIVLTTPQGDHRPQLLRAALQTTAVVALAALSWRLVEEPIRSGVLTDRRQPRARRHPPRARPRSIVLIPATILGAICVLELAMTGTRTRTAAPTVVQTTPGAAAATARLAREARRQPPRPVASRTSCRAVIHIGDSTSEGLTSTSYLPNPIQRIGARYRRVGATMQHYEISGARSIVETYEGQPNAADVVRAWKRAGYQGCWVLAIGTNDTANVSVGSHVDRRTRIRTLMSLIGNQPVMWVNLKSLLPTGPYAQRNMVEWNAALTDACRTHGNMRVFDWAAVARDAWFTSDGIHYTTPGYAARARLIANALVAAFPAGAAKHRAATRCPP